MLLVDCRDGDLRQGGGVRVGGLRELAASFVVPDPSGVAIRDRLRVSAADAAVLGEIGVFLGSLAAGDLPSGATTRTRPAPWPPPGSSTTRRPCAPATWR